MTREELNKLIMQACERTWNEKTCKEIEQALSQEPCERFEWGIDGKVYKITKAKDGKEICQQVCDDAVSRQAVLDGLKGCICDEWVKTLFATMVKQLPPVTQKSETVTEFADRCRECGARYGKLLEQKSGHWISHYDEDEKVGWYECDRCHTERAFNTRFCPDCGVYMREGRTLDEFIKDSKESEVKE